MPTMNNAHALIIGVADYENISGLPATVVEDARDIHDVLVDPERCGYPTANVQMLLNEAATRQGIRDALSGLAMRATPDSVAFIYISSHGGRIESGEHAGEYLLPFDTLYETEETLAETSISGPEFARTLREVSASHLVVVFDCCYAAGIKAARPATLTLKTGLPDRFYEELKAGGGRVVLASSRHDEVSNILAGDQNSLFTKHLLDALCGGVPSDDNLIRIFDLYEYIQPRVTAQCPKQHPVFRGDLETNFPVAFYLGRTKGLVPKVDEEFRYHAFISFAEKEPDYAFVWDTLVPRLEGAGLRIAVAGDVEAPGVERVVSTERAISQSKRTIVVLSENYLADRMGDFQNTLAQSMGLREGSYRLLPVKFAALDEGRLPERIAALVTLNLAHPRQAERQYERLIESLKGELPRMGTH
jgi:hypothetical protein